MGAVDGTVYLRARHYRPDLGRFLQRGRSRNQRGRLVSHHLDDLARTCRTRHALRDSAQRGWRGPQQHTGTHRRCDHHRHPRTPLLGRRLGTLSGYWVIGCQPCATIGQEQHLDSVHGHWGKQRDQIRPDRIPRATLRKRLDMPGDGNGTAIDHHADCEHHHAVGKLGGIGNQDQLFLTHRDVLYDPCQQLWEGLRDRKSQPFASAFICGIIGPLAQPLPYGVLQLLGELRQEGIDR